MLIFDTNFVLPFSQLSQYKLHISALLGNIIVVYVIIFLVGKKEFLLTKCNLTY